MKGFLQFVWAGCCLPAILSIDLSVATISSKVIEEEMIYKSAEQQSYQLVMDLSEDLLRDSQKAYVLVSSSQNNTKIQELYWDFLQKAKEFQEALNRIEKEGYSVVEVAYHNLNFSYHKLLSTDAQRGRNPMLEKSFALIKEKYKALESEIHNSNILMVGKEKVEYSNKFGAVRKEKKY